VSDLLTISALKNAATAGRVEARVYGQVAGRAEKTTRDHKPYWELIVADAEGRFTLRAWSDSPNFNFCAGIVEGAFIEVRGEFTYNGTFGLDAKRWECRNLTETERDALLAGPESVRRKQKLDLEFIETTVDLIADPRLHRVCAEFLSEYGDRFQRTAAARTFHHARRGGLVEHVGQMMRTIEAIVNVYTALNRDLLLAGALLHDCGKLWENTLPEEGFIMPYDERGEMLGHITIGIELVNSLWKTMPVSEWETLEPTSEDVRLHLLHLIASHHGAMEFGSPVLPRTPEAHALHYVDNLDAKLEMVFAAYDTAAPLAPRIYDRVRPLSANLVEPLRKFHP
jgi:3'-5' exoribonuclease